jgi:hypothetical protein
MRGFINTRAVLFRFVVIWREFGPRCAVRCVGAILRGRPTTFLDVAFDTRARARGATAAERRRERRATCPCDRLPASALA